jgi:hypothetical protein
VNLPNVAPIPGGMLSDDVVVMLDWEDVTEDCQRPEDEDSGSKYGSLYAYRYVMVVGGEAHDVYSIFDEEVTGSKV